MKHKNKHKNKFILEVKNISKSFPGVQALNSVQLRVEKGTVHALLGENGAGKSTLMKILIGIERPDEGSLFVKEKEVSFSSTQDALHSGMAMIHQELNPVPHMTVAENIFLGKEPLWNICMVNFRKMWEDTAILLKKLEINISPTTKMVDLSIAQKQMVEIAKAVSYNADLIIMDEPTSALTAKEVSHLFQIIRSLKETGVAIIFISHKLDEVFEITSRITVLRDGNFIAETATSDVTTDDLVQMMVGRKMDQFFPQKKAQVSDVVLSVEGFTRYGEFEDISFDLRKGEILGFSGLIGSGRSELLECVFGVTKKDSGQILLNGEKINIKSPQDAIQNRIGLLTEDRKLSGLFLILSVKDNIAMANIDEYCKMGVLNHKEIQEISQKQKELLDIKTPHLQQLAVNLSGGNQQKVLIARWLLTNPDILILDEPTKGIDVGAKAEVHRIMSELVEQGKSIIMISSELSEILGMSDRIVVMHEGKKAGELTREEATQEKIMHLTTGM